MFNNDYVIIIRLLQFFRKLAMMVTKAKFGINNDRFQCLSDMDNSKKYSRLRNKISVTQCYHQEIVHKKGIQKN